MQGQLWIGMYVIILVSFFKSTAHVVIKQRSQRKITTTSGKVNGVLVELPVRSPEMLPMVEGYFGIQYGTLKNDILRFMYPKGHVDHWLGIYYAERYSNPCPQKYFMEKELKKTFPRGRVEHIKRISEFINSTQEECLFLNIYVPSREKSSRWNDTSLMPVMIFVHGDSYDIGTGNAYDGSVLASYGDVIVVTVNYRLGVLGFLSTGDANASGNYALLDLLAVLQWVKQNIKAFGGDASRITLFGHGHGAALVNILLLSPLNDNRRFFQRAILQSGSAFSSWAVSVEPKVCALVFAAAVNCSNYVNDTAGLVSCLRVNKSASELVNNVPPPPKYYSCFAPSPMHGQDIFPFPVEQLVHRRESTFAQAEVMFGVTKNEAYSFMNQYELERGISKERKEQIIRTYVNNLYRHHKQKIFEILDHHYTEWDRTQNDSTRLENIMKLLSDGQYAAPIVKMAQAHAKTADTYFYTFAYSTKSEKYPEWSNGVHGDELPYVFGAPLVDGIAPFPSVFTRNEKKLSEAMMRMWTNFAKTGNPNPLPNDDRFADLQWPKYDADSQQYLQIETGEDGRRPKIGHHYRGKDLAIWLDLIPKINKPGYTPPGATPDPSRDALENAHNMSSFDDYERLLQRFHKIFPAPPPIPPITPPMNDASALPENSQYHSNLDSIDGNLTRTTAKNSDDVTDHEGGGSSGGSGPLSGQSQSTSLAHSSIPLSVTVAVGCSLLFLNCFIFAAVYYQRVRIKKLKRSQSSNSEEMRSAGRKTDKDVPKPPETTSLMTTSDQNQLSPVKFVNTKPPDIHNNALYSSTIANKTFDPSSIGYSYSAVPTHSSSPMHRSKQPHSQSNSTLSSKKSGHSLSNSRPPEISRLDSVCDGGRNTYKPEKYNQIKAKDPPTSDNAITIV